MAGWRRFVAASGNSWVPRARALGVVADPRVSWDRAPSSVSRVAPALATSRGGGRRWGESGEWWTSTSARARRSPRSQQPTATPFASPRLPSPLFLPFPSLSGTRNDESGWGSPLLPSSGGDAAGPAPENRLAVHTIRDARGRVLGLGSSFPRQRGGEGVGNDDGLDGAGGWEPAVEAWTPHEGAVTGIDLAGGFGRLVTSGGDG